MALTNVGFYVFLNEIDVLNGNLSVESLAAALILVVMDRIGRTLRNQYKMSDMYILTCLFHSVVAMKELGAPFPSSCCNSYVNRAQRLEELLLR